jgi:glycosyltransferase involved in cell wall biosynthesis
MKIKNAATNGSTIENAGPACRQHELLILGTRGVPSQHGGFETAAERLSLHLASKGWGVSVYCQEDSSGNEVIREEIWRGVRRIIVPTPYGGSFGSVLFDWKCAQDAVRRPGRILIFGYNTAIFDLAFMRKSRPFIMNMDGFEWKRSKWSLPVKAWFWLNEQAGGRGGTTLVADNPEIETYLRRHYPKAQIEMIPYGAPRVTEASTTPLASMDLSSDSYFIVICRIEPENSVLEIVKAFSETSRRCKLCVLGDLDTKTNRYHRRLRQVAGSNVIFPGAIYDQNIVKSLRFHARAYCHGHRFGGTNPSLVEALGAGNAIIAHDNPFNRWTAGAGQFYFNTGEDLGLLFARLDDPSTDLSVARRKAVERYNDGLTWQTVFAQYEALILRAEHGAEGIGDRLSTRQSTRS